MKRVMSVSLGSSSRNHSVEASFLGEKFLIERIGTDGDLDEAGNIIKKYDGVVDAFGLGGIDLYIYSGTTRYTFRDAERIVRSAVKTPVVDGSGLKNTLERKVLVYLQNEMGMVFADKKVLMVCAVDRFGMAQGFDQAGAAMTFGDLAFSLGIPITFSSLKTLERIARIIAPIVVKLPFKMLYPTGEKQEKVEPKFGGYYEKADIIAGDFHFIRRFMPDNLRGKVIITNTVTSKDVELLNTRGVSMLVTTTPELNGRSFGTNVMEGVLIALTGKKPDSMTPADYSELLEKIGFKPRILSFIDQQAK
ncbi:MAG: quinate 5-dehydrogenase [Thermincola sp.]|nr:quinate 5-dehydrogenase [Thermincola sp.]MDT3702169.1 quinate 5-dehydrogenase [Thermincola sp.]